MRINLSKKNYVISAGADGLGFAIANKKFVLRADLIPSPTTLPAIC